MDINSAIETLSGILIGIGVSVFTLAYGFIQNKREILNDIYDLKKRDGFSQSICRKENSANKFISEFKSICNTAILLTVISFIAFFCSIIDINDEQYLIYYILLIIELTVLIILLYVLWKNYFKRNNRD